jgi:hypothetical protein
LVPPEWRGALSKVCHLAGGRWDAGCCCAQLAPPSRCVQCVSNLFGGPTPPVGPQSACCALQVHRSAVRPLGHPTNACLCRAPVQATDPTTVMRGSGDSGGRGRCAACGDHGSLPCSHSAPPPTSDPAPGGPNAPSAGFAGASDSAVVCDPSLPLSRPSCLHESTPEHRLLSDTLAAWALSNHLPLANLTQGAWRRVSGPQHCRLRRESGLLLCGVSSSPPHPPPLPRTPLGRSHADPLLNLFVWTLNPKYVVPSSYFFERTVVPRLESGLCLCGGVLATCWRVQRRGSRRTALKPRCLLLRLLLLPMCPRSGGRRY